MFIIDDLVQSGGTLLETVKGIITILNEKCEADREIGIPAIKFNTLVTHSVFPTDSNVTNFFSADGKVDTLITSNTRPSRVEYIKSTNSAKVSVIEIAPVLHKIFTKSPESASYISPYSIN